MRPVLTTALTATLATLSACNAGDFTYRPRDASADASLDARTDAVAETGVDATTEAAVDASTDAARDATVDTPADAPRDATPDVTLDAAPDAALDVAPDIAPDVARDVAPDLPVDVPPACASPMSMCGAACVDTRTSVSNCGACGTVCGPVMNGTAACSAGGCHPLCNVGFGEYRGACIVPTTPRALSPISTSVLSVNLPVFRWTSDGMATGVRIEISRDRTFAAASEVSSDVTTGSTYTATTALPAGVHFWRLSARIGTVASSFSPVWEFVVPAVPAPRANLRGLMNDVNRDGIADLLVRSPSNNTLYVYHGASGDLPAAPTTTITQSGVQFPIGLGFLGDVNGDGYGDVAAARLGDNIVHVYAGSATGLPTTATTTIANPGATTLVSGFGWQIAGLGDTNGDGYGDVLISANGNNSRAYVFLGSASGLSATPSVTMAQPGSGSTGFGNAAVGLGDLNGDGYNDLAIGEGTGGMSGNGVVHLFFGSAAGIPAVATQTIGGPTMGMGGVMATGFGAALGAMTDIQNDGYNDLVIGSSAQQPGSVFVIRGQSGTMLPMSMPPMPVTGGATGENWGASLASGDINSDGFDDVVVSDTFATSRRGTATIAFGTASGLSGTLTLPYPETASALFGIAHVPGDLNGDGLFDIVVGAPSATVSRRVYVYRQPVGTAISTTPSQSINAPAGTDFGVGFAQ